MAQSEFGVISFDDLWDKDDALMMSRSDSELDVINDPFITPQSHHLFYPGQEGSSTSVNQRPKAVDMNFNTSPSRFNTENFDLLKLDKSPWHESDSGVSTIMSEAGSPSGCNDFSANEIPAQSVVDWSGLDGNTDDLATYLLGTDISMLSNEVAMHSFEQTESFSTNTEVTAQNICNTGARNDSNPVAPKHLMIQKDDISIDVENSDSECSNSGGISPERIHSQISEPLNYFQEVCSKLKRKPAVKVVKVLKASAGTDCCDDDIVKALDERSRKNAMQAKVNREKKKKYVNSLEKDIEKLGKENKELKDENVELKKDLGSLEEEVRYLKSVLVNASALSSLLRNISGVSELKLSASIVGRKRGASDFADHSYTSAVKGRGDYDKAENKAKRLKMVHENLEKAGVCLHVSGNEASLEFCAKCSSLAQHSQSR